MLTESKQQVEISFGLKSKETIGSANDELPLSISEFETNLRIERKLILLGTLVRDFLEFLTDRPHYNDVDVFLRGAGIVRCMRKIPQSFYMRYLPQNQFQVSDWEVVSEPNLWFALAPTYVVILSINDQKKPKLEWGFAFKGEEIFVEKPIPTGFEILDNGAIWIPAEKITVSISDTSWPYIVAQPNFFLALSKLEKLLTPGHSNYLTMLLADKQPNKGIGTGIAEQLKEVLNLLKISSPKISLLS